MLAPSAAAQPKNSRLLRLRSGLAGLLSFRYLLLRGWTAGGGLIAGLVQTFVFARVLDPERFSLFILVGALGTSMWLFDLGLSKIVFVRMRERFHAGAETQMIGAQASALAFFYALLITAASVACALALALRNDTSAWQSTELGLFFFFTAFNLAWFVFRNASLAVDEYIYFETLESFRRLGYILLMFGLLAGLPLSAFLILINVSWITLIAAAGARLANRQALTLQLTGAARQLQVFFKENRDSAIRTGTHAAGEVYIHGILYLVVPLAFGLGAPTIIVDTALKVFLGTLNLCSAACDLLVPRQTAAYSSRERHTLIRATLMALTLCAVPALAVAGLLLIDAKGLFALLLSHSAEMPAPVTPILFVLLTAGVIKTAPGFLLQYTGYFKEIARLSLANVLLMSAGIVLALMLRLDVVGLLAVYAAVFVIVAGMYLVVALRGPLQVEQGTAAAA